MHILAINPGGGSTKIGVYRNLTSVFEENLRHSPEELSRFPGVLEQYGMRRDAVRAALERHRISPARSCNALDELATGKACPSKPQASSFKPQAAELLTPALSSERRGSIDAVVARGGTLKPLQGGIYRITEKVVEDIRAGRVQTMHPSLLGPLIAHELAGALDVPAYFVDPESTDEFWPLSRLSGLPEIERRALSHALSVKTVAKQAAQKLGKRYERCNFVVAHLGTGITIAAHLKGRQVDASNANEDGPMAPQRSGALPAEGLVEFCMREQLKRKHQAQTGLSLELELGLARRAVLDRIQRKGGLLAYLGTDDIREVEKRIDQGDERAKLVYDAMIYQIAKEIGAYATVLRGKLDAVVLTGGMTLSRRLTGQLRTWIRHLAPRIFIFPGEEEMKALASAVLRLLQGSEKEKVYE